MFVSVDVVAAVFVSSGEFTNVTALRFTHIVLIMLVLHAVSSQIFPSPLAANRSCGAPISASKSTSSSFAASKSADRPFAPRRR